MRDGGSSEGEMGRVEGPRAGDGNEWLGASLRCRSVAGERPFAHEGASRAELFLLPLGLAK